MSSSLNDIKRRLASVNQTKQITNAMYLLSASRLKKAMVGMDYIIDHIEAMERSMADILKQNTGAELHDQYFEKSPNGTPLIMCIMGDKGLCGSYNNDVALLTMQKLSETKNAEICCFGQIGADFLRNKGIIPDKVFPGSSMHPEFSLAKEIAEDLIEDYLTDNINEVYVIYTPYSRAGRQKPVCVRLLPFLYEDFTAFDDHNKARLIYEPGAKEVFAAIVPFYCASVLFDMLMESSASENSARMEAMLSACESADEEIYELETELNTVRQLTITNEITEISAAAEAGKKSESL
ncbi:MAG: F0F1 ATP synthase subunit gamma [Oscillospiraceae bacterium]|nr:F0F1 ATP synthase subunit gamma [Oscillospiraceae bacterium]